MLCLKTLKAICRVWDGERETTQGHFAFKVGGRVQGGGGQPKAAVPDCADGDIPASPQARRYSVEPRRKNPKTQKRKFAEPASACLPPLQRVLPLRWNNGDLTIVRTWLCSDAIEPAFRNKVRPHSLSITLVLESERSL